MKKGLILAGVVVIVFAVGFMTGSVWQSNRNPKNLGKIVPSVDSKQKLEEKPPTQISKAQPQKHKPLAIESPQEAVLSENINKAEIQNLRQQVEELKKNQSPPLVIPESPMDCGRSMGSVIKKNYEMKEKFCNGPPAPDSPEYNDFVHGLDEIMMGMTPLMVASQKLSKGSNSNPSESVDFMAGLLAESLNLDETRTTTIQPYIQEFFAATYEKDKVVADTLKSSEEPDLEKILKAAKERDDDPLRQQIAAEKTAQIYSQLTPEEQLRFNKIFPKGIFGTASLSMSMDFRWMAKIKAKSETQSVSQ